MFYRNDERDDYRHMGAGTLVKSGQPDDGVLISPGTMHCGEDGVPFCSEAWGERVPVARKLRTDRVGRRELSADIFTRACRAARLCTAG